VGSMGGAVVGAWLGFHSTEDLLALITTIVGAAVGANLFLIALDIARDRSGRPRSAEARTDRGSMLSTELGAERART